MNRSSQIRSDLFNGPYFDMQVNGFAGVDFQSPGLSLDDIHRAAAALQERRIVKIFLTLITDDISSLEGKLRRIEAFKKEDPLVRSVIAGYHLEGPYLSPEEGYRGAHPGHMMKSPDLREFERLQEAAGGNVRLVTLAPELDGSGEFITRIVGEGVHVSIGHSNASEKDIKQAIECGARFCTHLGNGVPAIMHRHDNVVQRLLSEDLLTACLIPDGIHLPSAVLKNYYRAKPAGKVLFTSDCMAAADSSPGCYTLGGMELEVGEDRIVRQPGKELFAGSSLCLDEAPCNLVDWLGIEPSLAEALCGSSVAEAFCVRMDGYAD